LWLPSPRQPGQHLKVPDGDLNLATGRYRTFVIDTAPRRALRAPENALSDQLTDFATLTPPTPQPCTAR